MDDYTNTFTTVDRLKQDTSISMSVNPELIEPFINTAEIFWLKDTLGQALWTELKDAISGDTLSGNNYTLVENFIIPAANWYAFYEAAPFILYRVEAKGITKKYSDNSQPLDKKEFELFRQSIFDKAQNWRNRMVTYLCDNEDTIFTNWRASTNEHQYINKGYSGGIYLG